MLEPVNLSFLKNLSDYVNHRPAFELCMRHIKQAFCTFVKESYMDNPILTRKQFIYFIRWRNNENFNER